MKHQYIQFLANTLCNLAIAVSALPFVAVVLDPSLMGLFDLTSYLGLRGPLQASSSLLIAGVVLLVLFALQLAIIVTTKKIVLGFASFSRGELDASKLFVQLSKYTLIATLYLPFVRMVLNALFQHELNGVYMVVLGFNWLDGMGLMLGLLCLVASLYMQLAQTAIDDNRQIV